MSEQKKESSFITSVATKEVILAAAALAVAAGGTYVSTSQISALKETVEKNEGMLITTIRNVDQLVESSPEAEKFQELKKSIDLNSRTLEQIQQSLKRVEEKTYEQDRIINALKENASEWLGFEHNPPPQYHQQHHQQQPQQQSYSQPPSSQSRTRSIADML